MDALLKSASMGIEDNSSDYLYAVRFFARTSDINFDYFYDGKTYHKTNLMNTHGDHEYLKYKINNCKAGPIYYFILLRDSVVSDDMLSVLDYLDTGFFKFYNFYEHNMIVCKIHKSDILDISFVNRSLISLRSVGVESLSVDNIDMVLDTIKNKELKVDDIEIITKGLKQSSIIDEYYIEYVNNIGYVLYDHEYDEYLKLDGKDTYVVENLKLEPKYNFIKR